MCKRAQPPHKPFSARETALRLALSRMVEVYREGHKDPEHEPQVVAFALRVLAKTGETNDKR
jgi:hypothetical protein